MSTWHFFLDEGTPRLVSVDDGFSVWIRQDGPVTYLEFVATSLRQRAGEFADFLSERETPFKARTEREWWVEFLAFVGMRQNFPHVPVVPTDLGPPS